MNTIDHILLPTLHAAFRSPLRVVLRTASSITKHRQDPQNLTAFSKNRQVPFLSSLQWFHTFRDIASPRIVRVMSYRPHYQDSWRPPAQQRDSWRPSAEQPTTSEPDRRWVGTRVRYGEQYELFCENQKFHFGRDSWRPHGHEGDRLTAREEAHDQVNEDSSSRKSSGQSRRARRRKPNPTTGSAVAAPLQPQSKLDPSSLTFQPGNLGQNSSFNDGVPAPLRSVHNYARYPVYRVDKYYRPAKPLSVAPGRNGGNNANATTPGAAVSTRHWLRSTQPGASSAGITMDNVSHLSQGDPEHGLSSLQTSFAMAGMLTKKPMQYERKDRRPQQVTPPPAPTATDLYLAQARLPVIRSPVPRKLLVVLDLNGTLLVRPSRMQPRVFNVRPGVPQLLDYLLNNHVVMVYSSARPANVEAMVDALLSKKRAKSLAAIWGRDKLDLTPAQYNEKVQVYKKLEKVWADEHIQATCPHGQQRWNQANTVLVDDSHLKALSQPHNLIQVPEFAKKQKLTKAEKKREVEVVTSIMAKLEELKWAQDVSRLILRWQTGEIEPPRATQVVSLPKSEVGSDEQRQSLPVDGPADTSTEEVEEVEAVEVVDSDSQASSLERDMENLSTDPSPGVEDGGKGVSIVNQPAISAAEWREFLK